MREKGRKGRRAGDREGEGGGESKREESNSLLTGTFDVLRSALNKLRGEDFAKDEDLDFLQGITENMGALCEVNECVALSQEFDQPEGSAMESVNEVKRSDKK